MTNITFKPLPPEWLIEALKELQKSYPNDKFDAIMKYSYLDPVKGLPIQTQPLPAGFTCAWLPLARCTDCLGTLYTPIPGMMV
jgi:SWI/SNF-related matrix-associated actin-dependent regulator of chromatin subfamily B member 1